MDGIEYFHLARQQFSLAEGTITLEQVRWFAALLADHPAVCRIAETGFNAGCSAAVFLSARPDVSVISFDLLQHEYVTTAKRLIDKHYPRRHTLIGGDSQLAIPALIRLLGLGCGCFDMLFIDGGHRHPVPEQDLVNLLPLLVPGGLVVMDDYCERFGRDGVIDAWDKAVRQNLIRQFGRPLRGDRDRGWVVGARF